MARQPGGAWWWCCCLVGASEQGEVAAFQVPHILEARAEEVCSGELGPNAGAAAHNHVLVLGIERGHLLHKVGILLLPCIHRSINTAAVVVFVGTTAAAAAATIDDYYYE
jgi:hypothetical protein